jgi:putative restriction endonuclease
MNSDEVDLAIRSAAFAFLERETARRGDVLPYSVLLQGFTFEGHRVPLLGPVGIFKPKVLRLPISITTKPVRPGQEAPYDDALGNDGLLVYRYRGRDPAHPNNVGLRTAMTLGVPLVYLFGLVPTEYLPVWPVFVVADDPQSLSFSVAVEPKLAGAVAAWDSTTVAEGLVGATPERRYATRSLSVRLHQQGFRARVLLAYRRQCALCRLRHPELLDAAHILSDGHPLGAPVVPNGLSLCKLHHSAFDSHIIGVRPDLVAEIRRDVLDEKDGPMLLHGLQEFHGAHLAVPSAPALRPKTEFLEERYAVFRKAG